MRQLKRFVFFIVFIGVIIIIFSSLKPENEFILDIKIPLMYNETIDKFTRCLLDMDKALNVSSIPWFLTHGTALNYWRSKNFVSDDMDLGVFYEDLKDINLNGTVFVQNMKKKFNFSLNHEYGVLNHGKEWTFICPKSKINIDIFVFYPYNQTNASFTRWAASYNGLCDDTIYRKCRWGFPEFNLTSFEMYERKFNVVSLEFIIERYGKDYMTPKKYDYFQSLKILPNLIPEYKKQPKTTASKKQPKTTTSKKKSYRHRRK